ncbi:SRPBCC family protein [Sporichthya brevicatena]
MKHEKERVSDTITIAAGPAVVFALVTDLPRMGEWSPENTGGAWQNGATTAAVGARFLGNNANAEAGKSWDVGVVVTELDAPHRFAFRTVFRGLTLAHWIYQIEPLTGADGVAACTVTETWVDTRNRTMARLLGGRITGIPGLSRAEFTRRSIATTLANLKRTAESVAPGTPAAA